MVIAVDGTSLCAMVNHILKLAWLRNKRIKQEAVDALTTDGAHHKQYSLECILNWSCETEEEFEKLREEYEWNEGLPA